MLMLMLIFIVDGAGGSLRKAILRRERHRSTDAEPRDVGSVLVDSQGGGVFPDIQHGVHAIE